MTTNYLKSLQGVDLFESFSEEELKSLAPGIQEVQCQSGETLFSEGEPGQEIFILLEGSLKIWKEGRFITSLQPVDYIGEMAILEDKPRSATVKATEPSRLLKISGKDFQKYLGRQPRSLVSLMKNLSRRIRQDTMLIAAEFEKTNIMVHDMRNILSTFLLLNSVDKEVASEAGHRSIQIMQEARKNLASLMDEALAHSKRLHYAPPQEKSCLCRLLSEMLEFDFAIQPDLQDKQVDLSVLHKPPVLSFTKLDIRRVITNLVLNAAQASAPRATIEIEVDSTDQDAIVHVRDSGCGIAPHLREKIFEPRFTTRPHGYGLGLASCRQIITEKHGGTLVFESEPEKGSTFTFTLPLT